MKILFDTHIFLWYISADPQLPLPFRDAIRDLANLGVLSPFWESLILRPRSPRE
jgi:PIN domain nuclease of toxin-antitoxin system